MTGIKSFDVETTFARFKEVEQVKGNNGEIFKIQVKGSIVCFFQKKTLVATIGKSQLYERWLTIDGVLHYIQKVNNWTGGTTKHNYIKAEI